MGRRRLKKERVTLKHERNGMKTLCKIDRKSYPELREKIVKIVSEPRFLCRKCLRVASEKRFLCKAEKL
jgi:hypothetical protein